MTPQSVYFSPWVTYESGGAYLRFQMAQKTRLFPACGYGMKGNLLPPPFNELQVRNLANKADVITLCREVAKAIGVTITRIPDTLVDAVVAEASRGSPYWRHVFPTLVGEHQSESPFNLESLLEQANRELFCAGFNLSYIATTPECKEQVFDFLRSSPSRKVRLLISDPESKRSFAAWHLMGDTFLKDLKRSKKIFQTWILEAKKAKLKGTLDIRTTQFVNLTVLCIDPTTDDGQLVLTPSIIGKPHAPERPHFWISRRRQTSVFSYYWNTYYNDLFLNRSKRLK